MCSKVAKLQGSSWPCQGISSHLKEKFGCSVLLRLNAAKKAPFLCLRPASLIHLDHMLLKIWTTYWSMTPSLVQGNRNLMQNLVVNPLSSCRVFHDLGVTVLLAKGNDFHPEKLASKHSAHSWVNPLEHTHRVAPPSLASPEAFNTACLQNIYPQ